VNNYYPPNENIIRSYLKKYYECEILYLCVRKILKNSSIDVPKLKGINPFAIFLMVVAFI